MKRIIFALVSGACALVSCDHVENPYPANVSNGEIDWGLYPDGDSAHYANNAWPTFMANPNTDRNILIEDFTGHRCVFCPAAAELAHTLYENNAGRVYISTIHTAPSGVIEPGGFQDIVPPLYVHDFTCTEGLAIGKYFGQDWPGSNFNGNPDGTISRVDHGEGGPVTGPGSWTSATNSLLAANELKVNIQSAVNYYPGTRGIFLHTETEVLDASLTNELRIVVQLHEDSLLAPQLFPTQDSIDYVHRDILRGCIDGRTFGSVLDNDHLNDGKYYFNYSYKLPDAYTADNAHLLIYIRDAVTEEVYQVIKQTIE